MCKSRWSKDLQCYWCVCWRRAQLERENGRPLVSWGRGRGWHRHRHRGIRWHIKWLGTLPGFEVSPNWFSQASWKSLLLHQGERYAYGCDLINSLKSKLTSKLTSTAPPQHWERSLLPQDRSLSISEGKEVPRTELNLQDPWPRGLPFLLPSLPHVCLGGGTVSLWSSTSSSSCGS